jgi:hypothetical protein
MSTDDAAEALMISAVMRRYFTLMRGIPEERKTPSHHRDAQPAKICLAVLQRNMISLPTPDWFRAHRAHTIEL